MSTSKEAVHNHAERLRFNLHAAVRWPHPNEALAAIAFATTYYFAYRYGMLFAQTAASPFWFPDSILLCALLSTRPGKWWIFLLIALPIRLFSEAAAGMPLWFLLATYAIDSSKGLVAAWALRRVLTDPLRIESLRNFAVFCLIAVVIVPAGSGFAGAALRMILGFNYWSGWEQWFLGDALSQLVITPALLAALFSSRKVLRALNTTRRVEAVVVLGGLIVSTYVAAHIGDRPILLTEPRFYAPMLFLFWAALRFGMVGASISIGIWAVLFTSGAASSLGPFTNLSPSETALALQGFLFPRSLTIFVVGLSVEQFTTAQGRLRESEERFRNLADAAPALIWTTGTNKLCDFVNQGWIDFTGRPMEAQLGAGWSESVHPEDMQHCVRTYHSAFDARQPFDIEYRVRRYDGEYRWVVDHGIPRYTSGGDFNGYVGVVIDVSDRKRAVENERQLTHLLRVASLGGLSGGIAHELNQPLAAIAANAQAAQVMLHSENLDREELTEVLEEIVRENVRAGQVIRNLRNLLKRGEHSKTPIRLNDLITSTLQLLHSEQVTRKIRIETELKNDLPLVSGDSVELQQVLINLIMNAMEAMTSVPVSAPILSIVATETKKGDVQLSIRDNGPGMSGNELKRIFEPFFTTKEGGLGLGLSICWTIVSAHHGQLTLSNAPGGGMIATVSLPALPT